MSNSYSTKAPEKFNGNFSMRNSAKIVNIVREKIKLETYLILDTKIILRSIIGLSIKSEHNFGRKCRRLSS